MKQKILSAIMLTCLCCSATSMHAQDEKAELRQAVSVLKELDDTQSKEWAFKTLESSLEVEKDPYVMNVLGIAYLHGLGVEADTTKAVSYLEQAGEAGYTKAYHNLGMFFKYLPKDKQDFEKAYSYFMKGVEKSSYACYYDAGFMIYKGLGCEQNYAKSVELFEKSATTNNPAALFMLGLCYMNGYGVERDTERGHFFLKQSANLNFRDAMEELIHDTPENTPDRQYVTVDASMEIPSEMPSVDPLSPPFKSDVAGLYKGVLVTYDWSGANIIYEKPLSVTMKENNGKLYGQWIQEKDTIAFQATLDDNGQLKFDSTEIYVFNRYAQNGLEHYTFDTADICCDEDCITGQLRMYSVDQMEPERPMYLSLTKESADGTNVHDGLDYHISAYPVAGSNHVVVNIQLDEDASDVKICFYDQYGINKQNFNVGSLKEGKHSFTLAPNVSNGIYLVRAMVESHTYGTIIKIER